MSNYQPSTTYGGAVYAGSVTAPPDTTVAIAFGRVLTLADVLRPVLEGADIWMTSKHPEFGYEVSIHTHRASWHGRGETPEIALRAAIEAYEHGEDAAFARYDEPGAQP